MSVVKILFLIVAVISARPPKWNELQNYDFETYCKDFGKVYSKNTNEHQKREALFFSRLHQIREHNAKPGITYWKGVNHMTDWTDAERKRLNGGRPREMGHLANPKLRKPFVKRDNIVVPERVDWRGVVPSILTAVKDQGNCGSCWAHGATEQMESYAALATGKLSVLSQQQVTACTPNPDQCGGTGGCGGATAELAYEYVANSSGLTTEWFYPYTAHGGVTGSCIKGNPGQIELYGYVQLPVNDQASVIQALILDGPLAVNVDASSWSDYEAGIFADCQYNITIDHVVQLVGYGTDRVLNLDYWIIRNSWTPYYGEDGYIRLRKSANPTCGWDVDPGQGTGCNGGPPQMWACGMCGILMDTSFPMIKV